MAIANVRELGAQAEGWIASTREFLRAHPLSTLAVTVGVGFLLGKLVWR